MTTALVPRRLRTRRPGWAGLRILLLAVLASALAASLVVPAAADDLTDARSRVRKAIVAAQKDVAAARDAVASARTELEKSQAALDKARAELNYVTAELGEAREQDRRIAADLETAQQRLADAARAERQSEAAVVAQQRLIGVAVRTTYQQQTALVGVGVALDAETTGDLAQRLQWSDTIFDTSAAELKRLEELQAGLEAARRARAEAEQVVSEQRALSLEHLAETESLAADASAREATVANLVRQNELDKAAAEADLMADEQAYKRLQAQDESIQAQIRARIAAQKKAEAEAQARARTGRTGGAAQAPSSVSSKGFTYPVNAKAGSSFGLRFHPILRYWRMHSGTDFGAACGAPIYAVADGQVASAHWQGGFGNYVVIDHGRIGGTYVSSGYAHQSKMAVRAGQRVKQGQVIGYVGTTGLSTGCHLHLQIYANGTPVNPMKYL